MFLGEVPKCGNAQRTFQKRLASVQLEKKGKKESFSRKVSHFMFKVADLPIVSLASFESKREAHEKTTKENEKQATVAVPYLISLATLLSISMSFLLRLFSATRSFQVKSSTYCIACCKNFKTVKAYENHIQSKKHQEMILKFEAKPAKQVVEEEEESGDEEMEVEEVDSDEWEDDPIPITECLFCNHHSNNLEKNLNHMTVAHSFFLPDPEFLVNLEGLVEYLGAKVRLMIIDECFLC